MAEIGEDAAACPRETVLRHALFRLGEDLFELGLEVLFLLAFIFVAVALFIIAFVDSSRSVGSSCSESDRAIAKELGFAKLSLLRALMHLIKLTVGIV